MDKKIPTSLTSYDLLKAFAVITMVLDHVGFYFFPDDLWWRAAGRMSAPVWLFLIGYARSRDLPPKLWGGAGILILASGVFGPAILPTNILVNIVFIRLVLDTVMEKLGGRISNVIEVSVLIVLLLIPTGFITDYGTAGLAVAIFGAYARRVHDGGDHRQAMMISGVAAYGLYAALFAISFSFSPAQMAATFGLSALSFAMAYRFKPSTLSDLTARLPSFAVWFLQLCGRRSLEIYVGHLLVFKLASMLLGVEGHDFMNWTLID